jgi:hypothetical protein
MRSLVVYESSYGNTHAVAEAIANGLSRRGPASVVSVDDAGPDVLDDVDLVVVGGPTHVHGMSRQSSRRAAVEAAEKPDSGLHLDHEGVGIGVRDWIDRLPDRRLLVTTFDTRLDAPAAVTGRASKGMARKLRHRGHELLGEPTSFLVTKANELEPGEAVRATAWGEHLATLYATLDDRAHGR